jgi:uncharacterized protein
VTLRAPASERLNVPGPAGDLQVLIETPQSEGAQATQAFAVICHPHPLFGGTMDNKVVHTLARAYEECGAPAIRFNFRGVGTSGGSYDEGAGETEDTLAVIEYGRRRWPGAAVWLGGFSFGGAVAVRAAALASPQRVVLAAPAIGRVDVSAVGAPTCPWLIVQGDADELVPYAEVRAWADALEPAPAFSVLAGAGHFFHGRIVELREAVLSFMAAQKLS